MFSNPRRWLEKHFWPVFIGILVFAFVTRIYRLEQPPTYIFDEVYHAITAKLIHRNDPRAFEWWNAPIEPNTAVDWLHPPLAKYTQALGMQLFGENSFGWRISSVIFGTALILVIGILASEVFDDKVVGLVAALISSMDGLLLTQSRIAMNDIHVTFFITLTILMYVKFRKSLKQKNLHLQQRWLIAVGFCAGLAMGSKWSGIFVLTVVCLFEGWRLLQAAILTYQKSHRLKWRSIFTTLASHALVLVILPFFLYLLSYTQMFLQGKSLVCEGDQVVQGQCYCSQESSWWVTALSTIMPARTEEWQKLEARGGCKRLISHFSELNHQIWWYQTNLKATHPFQSRPPEWFLDLRPVWFYVNYGQGTISNIYAQGNPALFWLGDLAVIFTGGWLAHQWYRRQLENHFGLILLLGIYAAVWMPWLISPRIMFFYHYTPAVPFLAIILSYWLIQMTEMPKTVKKVKASKAIVTTLLILTICVTFVIFYPNWTGLPVPIKFAESVYFAIKSWR